MSSGGAAKVPEIEDAADAYELADFDAKAASERRKSTREDLVAAMGRHDVLSYSRPTWGSVEVKQPLANVKVKRDPSRN